MMKQRFWVIGGDYTCLGFNALRTKAPHVEGPFADRDTAQAAWRRISREHSSNATARFSIAVETVQPAEARA